MAVRVLSVFLLLTGASLWAAPCALGPLSGYLGPGFTCTAGGVDFDLWSYASGATGVPATSVAVSGISGAVFEFLEMGPGWTQPIGAITSGSIGFRGTGAIGGTRLYLGSGGFAGTTGGVTLVTAICLNGALPGCGGGSPQPSISSFNSSPGPPPVILSESFYPPAASEDILTTFTIDGGNGGAGLSAFQSGFYAAPEPSSFALAASGLAVVVAVAARRRRLNRRSLFRV